MSMIVNIDTKEYEEQSHRKYPENWNGDGWIPVSKEFEEIIRSNYPYFELFIDENSLTRVTPTRNNNIDIKKVVEAKHAELSEACQSTIYNGATITLSDGSEQYFTYNEHDQTNIFEMYSAVKAGATQYIYQAQDGSCMVYQAADIITIYSTLAALKTSTLTYYHQLSDYMNSLTSVDEINAVTFGQELTGEYLQKYNELMAVAVEQMSIVLGVTNSFEDTNNA